MADGVQSQHGATSQDNLDVTAAGNLAFAKYDTDKTNYDNDLLLLQAQ